MDFFSELIDAVQSDLTIGDETTLLDLTAVKSALNRSYTKIGAMFLWPGTKDAKKTSTGANREDYNYPPNWVPESIWKLMVDDKDYGDPLDRKDYLFEKENDYPAGQENIWSNEGNRYFIDPTPTTTGNYNLKVWGQKVVDKLTLDGDITIFSYSMREVNEAIILEAVAILKNKGEIVQAQRAGNITGSVMLSQEAIGIVTRAWSKIAGRQAKNQKTISMFNVTDMFASGNSKSTNIGNFK